MIGRGCPERSFLRAAALVRARPAPIGGFAGGSTSCDHGTHTRRNKTFNDEDVGIARGGLADHGVDPGRACARGGVSLGRGRALNDVNGANYAWVASPTLEQQRGWGIAGP